MDWARFPPVNVWIMRDRRSQTQPKRRFCMLRLQISPPRSIPRRSLGSRSGGLLSGGWQAVDQFCGAGHVATAVQCCCLALWQCQCSQSLSPLLTLHLLSSVPASARLDAIGLGDWTDGLDAVVPKGMMPHTTVALRGRLLLLAFCSRPPTAVFVYEWRSFTRAKSFFTASFTPPQQPTAQWRLECSLVLPMF